MGTQQLQQPQSTESIKFKPFGNHQGGPYTYSMPELGRWRLRDWVFKVMLSTMGYIVSSSMSAWVTPQDTLPRNLPKKGGG